MNKLILTHPSLGYIDEMNVTGKYFKSRILQIWRWRYGKQIDKCEIKEVEVIDPRTTPVYEETTQEYYKTILHASRATGVSFHTISDQIRGLRDSRIHFKFKRA